MGKMYLLPRALSSTWRESPKLVAFYSPQEKGHHACYGSQLQLYWCFYVIHAVYHTKLCLV